MSGFRWSSPLSVIGLSLVTLVPNGALFAQELSECNIVFQGGSFSPRVQPFCILASPGGEGAGRFEICPEVTSVVGYDDNAFRTEDGAVADGFVQVSPRVTIESVDTKYTFENSFRATINRQFRRTENNYVDLDAFSFVRTELFQNLEVAGLARFRRGHENRASLETAGRRASLPNFVRPTGGVGLTYNGSIGFASLEHEISHKRFTSNPGGVATGRNTTTYEFSGCVGTTFTPHTRGLVVGNFTYNDRPDGVGRGANDNRTAEILGTFAYEFSDVTALGIGLGWLDSRTEGRRDKSTRTVLARGSLFWRPTRLTTIRLGVGTTVRQTNLGDSSTSLVRRHQLSVRHDFTPALDVSASTLFSTEDVSASSTGAATAKAFLDIGYKVTDRVLFKARYAHQKRFGRGNAGSFSSNRWTFGLAAAY